MKRDWARVIPVGGAVMVIQSMLWEYARMRPDNSYFVEPWAFRGYESVHGTIFAVIGIALLVSIIVVAADASQSLRNSLLIVGAMVVAGWLIALVFGRGENFTLGGRSIAAVLIAVLIAVIVVLLVARLGERSSGEGAQAVARFVGGGWSALITVATTVVVTVILRAIVGDSVTMPVHVAFLLLLALLGTMLSLMKTPSMAANRMLMVVTIVAGATISFSGAAIRSTLTRFQAETEPFLQGQYRDTQVTWGYILAILGIVLVFAGAVMLWARRRDIVQSQLRAAKQRAAAEASARELAAAI